MSNHIIARVEDQNGAVLRERIVPLVHLNGTGKAGLQSQYRKAADALYIALDALADAAPNMRDYYLYEDAGAAFRRAQAEHLENVRMVEAVIADLATVYSALMDQ